MTTYIDRMSKRDLLAALENHKRLHRLGHGSDNLHTIETIRRELARRGLAGKEVAS